MMVTVASTEPGQMLWRRAQRAIRMVAATVRAAAATVRASLAGRAGQILFLAVGWLRLAKYLVLFRLSGETISRFVAKPSDRAAVIRALADSVGGSLESYYWMFGQYDGVGVFDLPDACTMAALSLAATSSGAFTHFETHQLIEVGDLAEIAERARGVAYQPPGA